MSLFAEAQERRSAGAQKVNGDDKKSFSYALMSHAPMPRKASDVRRTVRPGRAGSDGGTCGKLRKEPVGEMKTCGV
jgi:hypothetical protein